MRNSVLFIALACIILLGGCAAGPFRTGPWEIALIFVGIFGLGLYFLPTIIAAARRKKKMLGIVLLNALAGWSLVGWIVALVWAFASDNKNS